MTTAKARNAEKSAPQNAAHALWSKGPELNWDKSVFKAQQSDPELLPVACSSAAVYGPRSRVSVASGRKMRRRRKCERGINEEEQQKKTALNGGVDNEIHKQASVSASTGTGARAALRRHGNSENTDIRLTQQLQEPCKKLGNTARLYARAGE